MTRSGKKGKKGKRKLPDFAVTPRTLRTRKDGEARVPIGGVEDEEFEGVGKEIEGVDVGKEIEAVDVGKKIEAVDQKIEAVDVGKKIEAVEQKIEAVEQKIEAVEQKIEAVEQKIEEVEHQIVEVEKNVETCSDRREKTRLLIEKGKLETQKGKSETEKHDLRIEKHDLRAIELELWTKKWRLHTEKERLSERDVNIGDTLSAEHSLSKFVACLRNQKLQENIKKAAAGSLIKLPEGVLWLGDESTFTNELYVRPCYLELLEAKEKYFELKKALNAIVYTGTPGIGKSHMCAFVIAQKLIEGKTVYFEKTIVQDFFKLELEGGVRRLKNMGGLQLVEEKATAVYIFDGGSPSIIDSPVESQIFASPSESLFRPEKKKWSTWLFLYTPLFDLEEMCKCREAVSAFRNAITQEAVEAWFLVAGGMARTVLKAASAGTSLESWKAGVVFTAQSLNEKGLQKMLAGLRGSTFSRGSDSLFHWHVDWKYVRKSSSTSPDKEELRRFKRKMLQFASDWVANIIYLNMRLDSVLKAVSFIMSNTGEVETSALRGYCFETVSNMILSGGGTFQCRWLDTCDEFTLTLPVSQLCTYKSHEDASVACKDDLSVYCVPLARNEVAIDAMSSPFLIFQMASGAKHTINTALSKLLNALKEKGRSTREALDVVKRACGPPRMDLEHPVFVFCTTPTHFKNDFKTIQNFVSKSKVVENGPIIQQAVLEVPLDFVEGCLGQIGLKAILDSRSTLAQIN